jgi:hypothetical protein
MLSQTTIQSNRNWIGVLEQYILEKIKQIMFYPWPNKKTYEFVLCIETLAWFHASSLQYTLEVELSLKTTHSEANRETEKNCHKKINKIIKNNN